MQGRGDSQHPSAVRSFLSRRSARPRPAAGFVQAPCRCAAGHTEPALSGPGGPIAPKAQETHVLTCEVELLVPSVVTGRARGWRRLLERRRREGGGRRQAGRAQGEVCFPETSFIYNFSAGALGQGGAAEASPRSHPSSTQSRFPWDLTSQSPLRTPASGSSTFAEGRPTAGEKPQLPLNHGRVNEALYRKALACFMSSPSIVPDRVLSTRHWSPGTTREPH